MNIAELLAPAPPIPNPWSIDEFIRRVAAQRGRSITVEEDPNLSASDSVGVWVCGERGDVIVIPADSNAWTREFTICHELGHMLLSHGSCLDEQRGWLAEAKDRAPSFSAEFLRKVMRHRGHGPQDASEIEAEMFATAVMARAYPQLTKQYTAKRLPKKAGPRQEFFYVLGI